MGTLRTHYAHNNKILIRQLNTSSYTHIFRGFSQYPIDCFQSLHSVDSKHYLFIPRSPRGERHQPVALFQHHTPYMGRLPLSFYQISLKILISPSYSVLRCSKSCQEAKFLRTSPQNHVRFRFANRTIRQSTRLPNPDFSSPRYSQPFYATDFPDSRIADCLFQRKSNYWLARSRRKPVPG